MTKFISQKANLPEEPENMEEILKNEQRAQMEVLRKGLDQQIIENK